ncbi:unnamed protein product [Schistocephalus solidus]|uniref:GIY-YIG domain-containing protein n=1 Tax=Schistocephalus solidus TaxID=70667 RepID=A0A183SPS4_SCHSO|nr:unnamed protein product [Schistocephalus solidus]
MVAIIAKYAISMRAFPVDARCEASITEFFDIHFEERKDISCCLFTSKSASSLHTALSRVKDYTVKEQQSNVIYHIPCANCSSAYVGYTGRHFETRINEHKLAIHRHDPLSVAHAHAVDCDHHLNWDATEVVAMANTKQTREFLEAWHSNTNSINRHVDLGAHYEGLWARLTDLR